MSPTRNVRFLEDLINELRKLPHETEWVEFKVNQKDPDEVGEYLSALANSAALCEKAFAYVVWGIEDNNHEIVGTNFDPKSEKVGNEELENWLLRLLKPSVQFSFYQVSIDAKRVVVLEIPKTFHSPVQFKGQEFIRIGSYKRRLRDFPEKERLLWRTFQQIPFEECIAEEKVADSEVLQWLDYPAYFELLEQPLPESRNRILESLASDRLVERNTGGGWNIFNLGLMLFARRLDHSANLRRKPMRVIQYANDSRIETVREQVGVKGYASGFEGLISYIAGLLPSNEVIKNGLRKKIDRYPELAIRELIANALIHQDFSISGSGPMVEIFEDRIEVTNPGAPLVDIQRLVDSPPRSRNESFASFMRRIGICEERGSGWDKVVLLCEQHKLPVPLVEVSGENTQVVLFGERAFADLSKAERVRAMYFHACLRHVNRQYLDNSSVRERFGIAEHNSASASRLISEAIDEGVIVPDDPSTGPKFRRYAPWWVRRENLDVS